MKRALLGCTVTATVAATVAAMLTLSTAHAQTVLSGNLDVDLLRPAPGASTLIVAERPRVPPAGTWAFSLIGSYVADPLIACPEEMSPCAGPDQLGAVISDRLTGWLLGAYSLGFVELGLALPVMLVNESDFASPPGAELGSTGLGDLRASAKLALGHREDTIGLGVLGALVVPTGADEDLAGAPGFGLEAWALADHERGRFAFAAAAGIRLRTEDGMIENVSDGHAGLVAGGAAVDLWRRRLALVIDLHGAFTGQQAFEGVAALRFAARPSWQVAVGGGAGLGDGAGAPAWRAFAGVTFQHASPDTDGDGIADVDDRCVREPEDRDGHEDIDGCPDPDDDLDLVLDVVDGCRRIAEDRDGYADDDGCPDPDNDGDGVLDGKDDCPVVAEDADGFQDGDGCPEADNDGDGLADGVDECPNEPETLNEVNDDDGCPDRLVVVTSEKLELNQTIHFDTNTADIKQESHALLAEVARALADNPALLRIRIEGHTDDVGGPQFNLELSRQRAESVKRHLVELHGLDAARLDAKGYGKTRRVAEGEDDDARAKNRRVEFVIVKSPGGAK
ncbi:MAG: hypothetical protein EXR73_06055 [Myxococcales bacterium]|nr:hypothetical protein [Myxococcales bacterium]